MRLSASSLSRLSVMSYETLISFFVASVIMGLAPGPDNIFVMTQSAMHGKLAGVLVMLGLCSGLLVHTAAVTLGVAALLEASDYGFMVLRMVGAAYLLWLAWQALRMLAAFITPTVLTL